MNRNQLLVKLALFIGYLLFAGFSAYFTASSLSLNLLNGTNLWLVLILVFIVALLASWCLTNAINESQKRIRASRSKFLLNLIGFIVFWTFSFMTNVHYFFVEKHGYSILSKELIGAKNYIQDNTSKSNQNIEAQKNAAKMSIEAQINSNMTSFQNELFNTIAHHEGFGEACIVILKSSENALQKDAQMYGDKNQYVIFDDARDAGDRGITQYSRQDYLYTKYSSRMKAQLQKKLAVIEDFYERKKNQNIELTELLDPISELENKHLPAVEKDGSVDAYYKYYNVQDARVISKMPSGFSKKCIVGTPENIKKFNIYPSKRMFDTMSVWGDIVQGRLVGMTMIQWIIIALIFDIVSFILFALFRKQ